MDAHAAGHADDADRELQVFEPGVMDGVGDDAFEDAFDRLAEDPHQNRGHQQRQHEGDDQQREEHAAPLSDKS